ncbi:MAG TPA: methylated-DNA--[protein]-cysteine S-methyltransferase [Candidatus Binataceae bacterium]
MTKVDAFERENPSQAGQIDRLLETVRTRIEARLRSIKRPSAGVGITQTPLGSLLVAEGPRGLLMIRYLRPGEGAQAIGVMREKFDPVQDQSVADRVGSEVGRYLRGDQAALRSKIDLALVKSDFHRTALECLCEVPVGALITYGALANQAHAQGAQRAIGNAMGSNILPIYVPCHRVIRSDGFVGNYTGGADRKLKLLRAEGFDKFDSRMRVTKESLFGHRKTLIYCRQDCRAASRANSLNTMIFADPTHARASGLRPCRLCRPE